MSELKDNPAIHDAEPEVPSSGSSAVPPYVPYRSFRNFTDSLKQGIPARIDRSVMPSMSGALQSQLMSALRYLSLVTSSGHPTETLITFVNSEGTERVEALKKILAGGYPFLRKPFELKTATPRMIEEQFANAGASGGTIDKCINFFIAAAKEAEITLSPHLTSTRTGRSPRRARTARVTNQTVVNESAAEPSSSGMGELSWAQLLLSKFPSFDPGWPDDVKAKWFDAFDKLMKQGQGVAS
jgi:hypothetical protein